MALRYKDESKEPLESTDDSVSFYLRDIGLIPLLTSQEEVELAKRIERGVDARDRLETMLDAEEHARAVSEARDGDAARRKLIESNLRLVVSVARRYGDRGLPLADLIAEGNFGLMRAAEKFDYHKGYRFSTYATWWIRQAVARGAANQSRVVRLPIHVSEMVTLVTKTSHRLSQELGRQPTSEELATATDLSAQQVVDVIRASQHPVSLDQPFGRESDGTIGEMVEDVGADRPLDQALREVLREQVREMLGDLTDRERKVLSLRYGLEDDNPRTLEEVGREIGVTRERVRQIEFEALTQLRKRERAEALREFLS